MSETDPITRLNAALQGRYRIESELGEGGMATVRVGWALCDPSAAQRIPNQGVQRDPQAGGFP